MLCHVFSTLVLLFLLGLYSVICLALHTCIHRCNHCGMFFLSPGCVSRLIIGGVQTQIGDDAIEKVGVVDCPSCRNGLCRYGGSCRSAATKTGFQCQCAEGYSGQHCELVGTKCRPGMCGAGIGNRLSKALKIVILTIAIMLRESLIMLQ